MNDHNTQKKTSRKLTELQKYITSYFEITNQDLGKITSLFKETELKKGEYFTKSGHYCEKLSFVRSGFIRVYSNANDKEVTQWISTKGNFITDLYSFNFKRRARWNIQALTDCKIYTIGKENYALLSNIVPNWSEMEKQFIAGCFVELENRVFSHLSLSAEERHDRLFESNKELFNLVPLQYLASMLGDDTRNFQSNKEEKDFLIFIKSKSTMSHVLCLVNYSLWQSKLIHR